MTVPEHGLQLQRAGYQFAWGGTPGGSLLVIGLGLGFTVSLWRLYHATAERRQAVQGPQASEQRFHHLIEGSLLGILMHRDFRPVFLN